MGDYELAEMLRERGIVDERVLNAIRLLHRVDFVPAPLAAEATADAPVSIGYGQTISQPYIVAYMTQELNLKGPERMLEIGTGSGPRCSRSKSSPSSHSWRASAFAGSAS